MYCTFFFFLSLILFNVIIIIIYRFLDSSTKKLYQAKAAFQVYVKPGSYTIGPQQLGLRDPIDVRFSNNDLEWYIKEENSIILHSLLMKVDPA